MKTRVSFISIMLVCPIALLAAGEAEEALEPIVVSAPAMTSPLSLNFDPKTPQQPLPAHDGAAFLKAVPGMSVVRKGGTDGDPVFRGMAGSRLGILMDGQSILGGCGNRMDPPTAYVFPEAFDRVTVLKGPQSVLHGPGSSAGVVLFERDRKRLEKASWKLRSSVMGGSFGRHDEVLDATAGTPDVYGRITGTHSRSGDYEDGDGKSVHSQYKRWSAGGALGWTPDKDTFLELSANRSDGEAAYADRTMDGTRFDRENYGLKFEKQNVASWLEKVEGQVYDNYIDHVMDNFTLRPFVRTAMMPNPSASNPDRKTVGGRLAAHLNLSNAAKLVLGVDAQGNKHTLRATTNQTVSPFEAMARTPDANFAQQAVFGEWTCFIGDRGRLIAGMRSDWWQAEDQRQTLRLGMRTVANPTANGRRDEVLGSQFARYEHDLAGASGTVYAGLGGTERFPDYWELVSASKEGPTAADTSAFASTRPERTTQLDLGTTWKRGRWSAFVAGFANRINDFILIQSGVARGTGMTARTATIVRNIDATTWGCEAGLGHAFSSTLKGDLSLAYVNGTNETEHRPLAQIPPLETRLGLTWDNKVWSVGSLLRLVSAQDRFAVNQGNIVGQDIGRTPGFGVFSLNGGWRSRKGAQIVAGVDNLFDKTYAEHISRSGAMVAGYEQTTRVNEPGRTLWIKASLPLP